MTTSRLEMGPFRKPLGLGDAAVLTRFTDRAERLGFAIVRTETDQTVHVVAVLTSDAPELVGATGA